jgi:acyl-CoA thioester hydrolase
MDRDRVRKIRRISALAELREAFPLVIETDVVWGEMDAYQHVNNVVYFRYFENARVAYLTRSGWDAMEDRTGVGIAVRRIEAAYYEPLQYPCHIWLAARILVPAALRGDRFTMEYAVGFYNEGGTWHVAVIGESDNVLIKTKAAPPTKAELTEEIKKLIVDFESGRRSVLVPGMPIIGVVGMTKGVSEEVSRSAEEVGGAVITEGSVLLTGGRPSGADAGKAARAVKDAAMDGAARAGAAGHPARMIGILPKEPTPGTMMIQPNQMTYCLLVHTTLTSYQRNCLTGGVPDGVISLKGKAGTLSEVGLAHQAGRPVAFLDSFDHLRGVFRGPKDELVNILREVKDVYPGTDIDGVVGGLNDLFEGQRAQVQTVDPEKAVEMVLTAISKSTGGVRSASKAFVEVQGCTVSTDLFEKQLLCLIK